MLYRVLRAAVAVLSAAALAGLLYAIWKLLRRGGDRQMFEELFGAVENYTPKAETVQAYTLQADIATPNGIIPAGTKFSKVHGVWTFVDAAAWNASYDPQP